MRGVIALPTIHVKQPNKWDFGCKHQYKLYNIDSGELVEELAAAVKRYVIPLGTCLVIETEVEEGLYGTEFYRNNAGKHVVANKADASKAAKFL